MKTFTRDQYMNNECTFHEYYRQFAIPCVVSFVKAKYTPEYIRERHAKDENMNNLSHGWLNEFDAFTKLHSREFANVNMKINGKNVYSLSDGTCAIKTYMRIHAGLAD